MSEDRYILYEIVSFAFSRYNHEHWLLESFRSHSNDVGARGRRNDHSTGERWIEVATPAIKKDA